MVTYTTYVDLQNGNDARTWAQCQASGTPLLTLAQVVTLAKAGANTASGDTVNVMVTSTEDRTAQTVTMDWDCYGLTFNFQPYNCGGNTGGRWFCKGFDAATIMLVNQSVIANVAHPIFSCTFTDMNFLAGAATTRIIHRDANTTDPVVYNFVNCVIDLSAVAGSQIMAGTGAGGTCTFHWERTSFNTASQFLSGASAVTTLTDGGDGDTSSITQTAGTVMEFSSTLKLSYFSMRGTSITVTGALTDGHCGIDFTNNNASLIEICHCKFVAASSNGMNLIVLPDTGATAMTLNLIGNDFSFTGTGTATAVVTVGNLTTAGAVTRKDNWDGMNHNFTKAHIKYNSICNSHATTGGSLYVGVGVTNAVVHGNFLSAGLTAHSFYIACNDADVQYNVSFGGGLAILAFGSHNNIRHNLMVAYGGSVACIIGRPSLTSWEPTDYWSDDATPYAGGASTIVNNVFIVTKNARAFTDYSDTMGGSWAVLATVANNVYYTNGTTAPLYINSTTCSTIAAARTAWAAAPISNTINDMGSKIISFSGGDKTWIRDLVSSLTTHQPMNL